MNSLDQLNSLLPHVILSEWIPSKRDLDVIDQVDREQFVIHGYACQPNTEAYALYSWRTGQVDWGIDTRRLFGMDKEGLYEEGRIVRDPDNGLYYSRYNQRDLLITDPRSGRIAVITPCFGSRVAMLEAMHPSENQLFLVFVDRIVVLDKAPFLREHFYDSKRGGVVLRLDCYTHTREILLLSRVRKDPGSVLQVFRGKDGFHVSRFVPGTAAFSHIAHVHIPDMKIRERFFPLIAHTDMDFLERKVMPDPDYRERYALLLVVLQWLTQKVQAQPILIQEGKVLFSNNRMLTYDLNQLDGDQMRSLLPAGVVDHLNPMFDENNDLRRGVRLLLDQAPVDVPEDAVAYVFQLPGNLGRETVLDAIRTDRLSENALENAIRVLTCDPDPEALAERLLAGSPLEKLCGLALITGWQTDRYDLDDNLPVKSERGGTAWISDNIRRWAVDVLRFFIQAAGGLQGDKWLLADNELLIFARAMDVCMDWDPTEGGGMLRQIACEAPREYLMACLAVIGAGRHDEAYIQVLEVLLREKEADVVSVVVNILHELKRDEYALQIRPLMLDMPANMALAAVEYMGDLGSPTDIIPLMYLLAVYQFITGGAREFSGTVSTIAVSMEHLLSVTLSRNVFQDDEWLKLRKGKEKEIVRYAWMASLACFWRIFYENPEQELCLGSGDRFFRFFDLVKRVYGDVGMDAWVSTSDFVKALKQREDREHWTRYLMTAFTVAIKQRQDPGQWVRHLEWLAEKDWERDALYVAAMWIFAFGLPAGVFGDEKKCVPLLVHLEQIFVEMAGLEDYRGILGTMALVELGLDRSQEAKLLVLTAENDWRGWHVLKKMGRKILRYIEAPDSESNPDDSRFSEGYNG